MNYKNRNLDEISIEIKHIKDHLNKLETKRKTKIIKDLIEKSLDGKYKYSYRELAARYGLSPSTIQKIAEENGLKRS